MNNQIQLVLKSSTTELSLNDRELGIYLTPELDGLTGLPEIRTTSGVNAGYDGGWTSAQNYDARSITIRGVIANEDVATVEQLRRQLTTLAGQGKNEELTLDLVTQAGKAYTIQVRTIALEMSLQKVLTQQEFMLQLRADDPLIYDASETGHEALLQVAQATGGFTIDFELPLAITGSSEETVVNNEGLEQVPTITRMYGALHNPKIINQTTNQFMQINADLGFAEGDWIEPSDVVSGKDITINGAPEGAPLSSIQIDGETSQKTYSGKNLLNEANIEKTTRSGITVTYNATNSTITIDGTATAAANFNLPSLPTTEANVPYAFSYWYISGSGTCELHYQDGSHSWQGYNIDNASTSDRGFSRSFNTSMTFNTRVLRVQSGTTCSNLTFHLQFEKSSTVTDYEPYVGGTASPNPDYPQAVQTVTGENVVKICGKNLFDINGSFQQGFLGNIGEISYSVESVTCIDYIEVKQNTTYAISYSAAVSGSMFRGVCFYDANKAFISRRVSSSGLPDSFTTPSNTRYMRVYFYNADGMTVEQLPSYITNIQIEKGSAATAYEPYQGQSYEVNLGKNLFNPAIAAHPSGMPNNLGETLRVDTNTTYTFNVGNDRSFAQVQLFDNTGTRTRTLGNGAGDHTLTFTTTSSEVSGLFCFYPGQAGVDPATYDYTGVQLEKGSTATSYAAYFEPIELCKIGTYQDYIYKDGDKWYVRKAVGKVVLNGSESDWTRGPLSGDATYRFFVTISGIKTTQSQDSLGLVLSDKLIEVTNGSQYSGTEGIRVRSNGTEQLSISTYATQTMTVDNFKTWLATNNIIAYYALATPTDTEITNEALIEQLEALAAATMYNPQTNITTLYADGNEQGTLSISYFTDKNPDTRDELVIDSRLRTITLNGLDVYHLQAPGSEFLMLAPGENRLSLQSDITGDNGYAQVSYKQGYLSI